MNRGFVPLLLAAILLAHTDGQQTLEHESCDRTRGHQAVIQPDADAFIAGLFSFHQRGENGAGCGDIETGSKCIIYVYQ